jgi:hypothetical protein
MAAYARGEICTITANLEAKYKQKADSETAEGRKLTTAWIDPNQQQDQDMEEASEINSLKQTVQTYKRR